MPEYLHGLVMYFGMLMALAMSVVRAWWPMRFVRNPGFWKPMPVHPGGYTLSLTGSKFPMINYANCWKKLE